MLLAQRESISCGNLFVCVLSHSTSTFMTLTGFSHRALGAAYCMNIKKIKLGQLIEIACFIPYLITKPQHILVIVMLLLFFVISKNSFLHPLIFTSHNRLKFAFHFFVHTKFFLVGRRKVCEQASQQSNVHPRKTESLCLEKQKSLLKPVHGFHQLIQASSV